MKYCCFIFKVDSFGITLKRRGNDIDSDKTKQSKIADNVIKTAKEERIKAKQAKNQSVDDKDDSDYASSMSSSSTLSLHDDLFVIEAFEDIEPGQEGGFRTSFQAQTRSITPPQKMTNNSTSIIEASKSKKDNNEKATTQSISTKNDIEIIYFEDVSISEDTEVKCFTNAHK